MVADDKLLGLRLSTAVVHRNSYRRYSNRSLSLCVGILEIAAIPVMWRFSDFGALELLCSVVDRFSAFSDE